LEISIIRCSCGDRRRSLAAGVAAGAEAFSFDEQPAIADAIRAVAAANNATGIFKRLLTGKALGNIRPELREEREPDDREATRRPAKDVW
jgi:hypothetical protein